ncbi:MAG: ParA family protein [Muribaculum sp.]|nr:ParA family protein [Muribaculum sp.]
MNATVISIANHKGGVGKTTSVATLGVALSLRGKRVLLVDLDAQQNLSYTLTQNEDPERSVYHALVEGGELPIVKVRENVDLVPASLELARAEIDLASKIARERLLSNLLAPHLEKYDYVIFDCPPSLGVVTTNALVASDELYIPLTAEALPLKGLAMLDEVVGEIQKLVNPRLKLGGVFFTRYNNRKLNKDVVETLENRYGEKVFATKIRENISLAEMPLTGQSIYEYEPKCNGAKDYLALADEIISRHASQTNQ